MVDERAAATPPSGETAGTRRRIGRGPAATPVQGRAVMKVLLLLTGRRHCGLPLAAPLSPPGGLAALRFRLLPVRTRSSLIGEPFIGPALGGEPMNGPERTIAVMEKKKASTNGPRSERVRSRHGKHELLWNRPFYALRFFR